jgi:hypothetical protein
MKTVNNIASVSILVMAIAGCGGGGGDSSNDTTTPVSPDTGDTPTTTNVMTPTSELKGVQTGSFQDAAVKGLTYWTASNGLGVTGDAGSFSFVPGEVIALYIGNELLILTDAELYSTPMDTLSVRSITEPGEGHPHQSLNVLRLLQTIDTTPDQDLIAIPESFHNDRNGNVVGLNFAQDTEAFANSAEVAAILTEAGKQGEQLIDRSVAAAHLKATLEGLDNNVIDLRGTWVANSSYLDRFGETPESSCMEVGPATWVVGDNDVFLYGDELNSDSNGSTTTCNGEDYGQADTSDWPGVNNATRDGNAGVEWLIADNGALDFNCGPECTLAELRGTIDDWEERCLANDFYTYKNEGSIIDQSDTDYCAESEDHNGPVVGYSEITYADRLGGDRILRVKRDFYAITAPASTAERADDFVESGLGLDIMNREEALAGTLDLTQGEWVEKVISSTDTQTVDGGTYVFPLDNGNVDLKCAAGFNACTWEELNDSYNDVQYIHVRGTNVINWVDGDTVGTLTRVE